MTEASPTIRARPDAYPLTRSDIPPTTQEQPRCQGARTQRPGPQRGGAPPAGAPPRVSAPPASQPEPVVSLTLSAYSVECEAPLPDPPTQGHPALHSSSGLQSSYLSHPFSPLVLVQPPGTGASSLSHPPPRHSASAPSGPKLPA